MGVQFGADITFQCYRSWRTVSGGKIKSNSVHLYKQDSIISLSCSSTRSRASSFLLICNVYCPKLAVHRHAIIGLVKSSRFKSDSDVVPRIEGYHPKTNHSVEWHAPRHSGTENAASFKAALKNLLSPALHLFFFFMIGAGDRHASRLSQLSVLPNVVDLLLLFFFPFSCLILPSAPPPPPHISFSCHFQLFLTGA